MIKVRLKSGNNVKDTRERNPGIILLLSKGLKSKIKVGGMWDQSFLLVCVCVCMVLWIC